MQFSWNQQASATLATPLAGCATPTGISIVGGIRGTNGVCEADPAFTLIGQGVDFALCQGLIGALLGCKPD